MNLFFFDANFEKLNLINIRRKCRLFSFMFTEPESSQQLTRHVAVYGQTLNVMKDPDSTKFLRI